MRRFLLVSGGILAASTTLALAAPESLLPPGFDDPPPPAPQPVTPSAPTAPQPGSQGPQGPALPPGAVVQPVPGEIRPPTLDEIEIPIELPSLEELEEMETDEIDELLGLKPRYDIPRGARRALAQIGVIDESEGGFPAASLARQPEALIHAALSGLRGPVVSRWGHILLRRALASRADAPDGMDPVTFAALRAAALNRLGEVQVARSLVQDVDSANYDRALADAAFEAYLVTGDLLGMCPVAQLKGGLREDGEWNLLRAVCFAYSGQERRADRDLNRILGLGQAPRIDVLLAQRFAGAAGDGSRALNIEWDGVNELTVWRFSLARALGENLPEGLDRDTPIYDIADVMIPAVPLTQRMAASERAARHGILSSSAMVDLYAQVWADSGVNGEPRSRASDLREAYVAAQPSERYAAMQRLWGEEQSYGQMVLTAYAAARLPVEPSLMDDPSPVIASMLTAGLDLNALRWFDAAEDGSTSWALLSLARRGAGGPVERDALDRFVDDDSSEDRRRSRFLLAGLAGLDRVESDDLSDFSERLDVNFDRESNWSRAIGKAGEYRNAQLVSLLAGLGMQGEGWHRMTARHLFHIVKALRQAGLVAEARMIAAEAVARG